MKLALTLDTRAERDLIYCQQVGVRYVLGQPDVWDRDNLRAMRHRVAVAGLELVGVELPTPLYANALLGAATHDEWATLQQLLRDVGEAGISTVSYGWALPAIAYTSCAPVGRGGATVRACDPADLPRGVPSPPPATAARLWQSLAAFLDALLPVAEHAGVRLAMRVDLPALCMGGGAPQIISDLGSVRRCLDLAPSPAHGVELNTAALAWLPGIDLVEAVRQIARRRKLFALQLASMQRQGAGYRECFLDEGLVPVPQVLAALAAAGYDGIVRTAPPPAAVGDTVWGHKGRAHDVGYVKATWQVVERLPETIS